MEDFTLVNDYDDSPRRQSPGKEPIQVYGYVNERRDKAICITLTQENLKRRIRSVQKCWFPLSTVEHPIKIGPNGELEYFRVHKWILTNKGLLMPGFD